MAKRKKPNIQTCAPASAWQRYQTKLRRQTARRQAIKRIPVYAAALIALLAIAQGVFWGLNQIRWPSPEASETASTDTAPGLDAALIPQILADIPLSEATRPAFHVTAGNGQFGMQTSIDPELQQYAETHIDKKYAKYFALVAMKPESGKIVAMVSLDKTGRSTNVCTRPDFPAASLFKIVTAAAAIEEYSFRTSTPMAYNGRKHTLYKSQLKPADNKYTRHIDFADSFAESINPVFGKIGTNRLKKAGLEKYARAFGFNRKIPFDLPLSRSPLAIKNEPYHWAEIASGFNQQTLISPLHAAVLASAVVNQGKMMRPILIESVRRGDETLYESQAESLHQAVSPDTAAELQKLMQATVTEGTARRMFRDCRRDAVLSGLTIGGKTGSINNNPEKIKYDWFTGFAKEKNGSDKLAVSVFVAHKDYIGTRSGIYAKNLFKQYFSKNQTKPRI